MWKITSSIVLVVLLINFTSAGLQRWYKSQGVANINCPLTDDPDDPTLLQLQGDCSKFLKCSYGLAYTLSCPTGLQWSDVLKRCEAPSVANCNSDVVTAAPNIGGNGCAFSYQRHPTDCSRALQCVDGVTYEVECPDGSFWDSITNKCSFNNYLC